MIELSRILNVMKHNTLSNYIVPGLSSSLIGGGEHGLVRIFEAERGAQDFITPHSHRFSFVALVLRGHVMNTLYHQLNGGNPELWCVGTIGRVCGTDGIEPYKLMRGNEGKAYRTSDSTHVVGDVYAMEAHEIHSIRFSKGARVLMFEGPQETEFSYILEPWINGRVVPTFKTEDWMFERARDN